jgi:hypothetical protein
MINNYNFEEGEPLNLVAHSHGGNVVKEFTNLYDFANEVMTFINATGINVGNQSYSDNTTNYKTIDNAVLLGTPHMEDYTFDMDTMTDGQKPIAVGDKNDIIIQNILGGTDFFDFNGIPSKKMPNAINITIEQTEDRSIIRMSPSDLAIWGVTGARPQQSIGAFDSHTGLNTPKTWKSYIDPVIKNISNK